MNTVFIQCDDQQLLGAKVARFAIEKNLKEKGSVDIRFMNVNDLEMFKEMVGHTFLKRGKLMTYTLDDLQAFTLSRIMPPSLMGYSGKAVVIDPDIFFLTDINELFNMDMKNKAIACTRYHEKNIWEASMMLLDCSKLTHWKPQEIISKLINKELDYYDVVRLGKETSILEIPRVWNSFDKITPETKVLHTTNRLTQPWKTGLPIDFTRKPMPKIWGIIPREPVHKLLGKYPTTYQPHPDKEVEKFFFNLVREALESGAISREEVEQDIKAGHVREDLLEKI